MKLALLACATVAMVAILAETFLPEDERMAAFEAASSERHSSFTSGCDIRDLDVVQPPGCTYGAEDGEVTIVLFGDSHARQWMPALELVAEERQWRLVQHTKSACSPFAIEQWRVDVERRAPECAEWRRNAISAINELAPDLVLVGSFRRHRVPVGAETVYWRDPRAGWEAGMIETLGSFADARVVLLADTPRFLPQPLTCLAEPGAGCRFPRREVISAEYEALEHHVAQLTEAVVVSASDWLCTVDACPMVIDGALVYRDNHHVSVPFMRGLAGNLEQTLAALLDGPASARRSAIATGRQGYRSYRPA